MKYTKTKLICKQPSATIYLGQETKTGTYVALKQFEPEFNHAFEHEFNILQKVQGNPNIIKLLAVDVKKRALIEECMYQNILQLYQTSKTGTNEIQTACILLQGALALHHLHSLGYVHRDIKPQNLMFERDSNLLKLIDYGWTTKTQNAKTHECCTRWYQAPQSLLELGKYSSSLDIFGLGCSVAQFFQLHALFEGDNQLNQLYKIFEILGVPRQSQWPEAHHKIKQLGLMFSFPQQKTLKSEFLKKGKTASAGLLQLLEQMLELNPNKRISAIEIIKHPYFKKLQGFDPKQHLPEDVYKSYMSCLHASQPSAVMTKTAFFPLNDIKNVTVPINNNNLGKAKHSTESETSILDSMKRHIV